MGKVKSSNVDSINYSPDSKILEVHFKGGKTYHYGNVSQQSYNDFEKSPSIGTHLRNIIHPKHTLIKKV